MTQVAHLGEVIAQPQGSQLVVAASVSDSTLTIDYAGEFSAKGGMLDLNGAQLEYDSITEGTNPADPDVINLTVPLAVTAGVGDWVGVVAGGQALVDYVAICATDDGDEIRVPITDQQIPFYPVGIYDPAVPLYVSDDLQLLQSSPGRTPALRGDQIIGIPYRTAESGERVEIQVVDSFGGQGQINFYSDSDREDPLRPAHIYADDGNIAGTRVIDLAFESASPVDSSGVPVPFFNPAGMSFRTSYNDVTGASTSFGLGADDIALRGDVTVSSGGLVALQSFQSGVEPSPSGTTNVTRTLNVTFATPFDVTPVVTATILVASSTANVRWQLGAVSTTGFTVYALRVDAAGSYDLHWQATAPTQ